MNLLRRAVAAIALAVFYLAQLFRSTAQVARMVITPGVAEPVVIALELSTRNPWTITTFANLLSLTPGSFTLEVAEDHSEIYVHVLTTRPLEDIRSDLLRLQDRVRRVMP